MKMPWLNAEVVAPVMSFILALLRTMYQGDEPKWSRRILESMICGMLTLTAGYAIDAMGLNGEWKYAVAGAIGFMGVDFVRQVAAAVLKRRCK
ncbi:hypothetical protein [Yersinia phage fEV-1]|nr:hypothetical protein [Yersinia phage fEV-1]